MTNDLTSATLARSENNFRDSVNFFAFSTSPLISNVNIEPAPFGKYLSYSSFCLPVANDGWFTFSTSGCSLRNSTTFNAFST